MIRKSFIAVAIATSIASTTASARVTDPAQCTDRTGLYLQQTPLMTAYKTGKLKSIVESWPGSKSSEIEFTLVKRIPFQQWKIIWAQAGLQPKSENAIVDFWRIPNWYPVFQDTVTAARAVGITSIAPIFSPNAKNFPLDSFSSNSKYSGIRSAALFGGGLTLDTPPAYFLQRGKSYQNFSYDQVRWAHAHNIRVTVIFSPYGDDKKFLKNTQTVVNMYKSNGALPTEWAVENYNSSSNNVVGCSTSENSVAGVSSWLALKAQTKARPNAASLTEPQRVFQAISERGISR